MLLGPLVCVAMFWLLGIVNFAVRFGTLPSSAPSFFMTLIWFYVLGGPLLLLAGIIHAVAAIWFDRLASLICWRVTRGLLRPVL